MDRKLLGIINVGLDAAGEVLVIYSAFVRYFRKKWEYNEEVHQLFTDYRKACDSVRREVLCDVLIQFGIPVKLASLIKLCLNEMCNRLRVGKHFSDMFSVKIGLKQGDALTPLLFNLDLKYANRRIQVNQDGLKLN
jgi:uncharacterized protein Yka (UPF0111/DUF47 family)